MGISSIELVRRVAPARPVFVRSTKQRALTIHLLSATGEVMSAVEVDKGVGYARTFSRDTSAAPGSPTNDRWIEMVGTALDHSCGEAVKAGRAFARPTNCIRRSQPCVFCDRAAISVGSLSRRGEGWGEGVRTYREIVTPHPTPLPMGEGADRVCRSIIGPTRTRAPITPPCGSRGSHPCGRALLDSS